MDDHTWQNISRRAIAKAQKKARRPGNCLIPGCNQRSINSHSQQRRGQLLSIAVDGHVYALKRDYLGHFDTFRSFQGMAIERVGVSKVSVFSGFCRTHDNNLFAAIEKRPFCSEDQEQAILLGLRAIAYESAQKRKVTAVYKSLLKDIGSLMTPEIRERIEAMCAGTDLYVKRESSYYLTYYLRAMRDPKNVPIVALWKVIPKNLELSTSCCICPWFDDYFERWSRKNPQSIITFSVVPTSTATHVVVTYPQEIAVDAGGIRRHLMMFPSFLPGLIAWPLQNLKILRYRHGYGNLSLRKRVKRLRLRSDMRIFAVGSRRVNIQKCFLRNLLRIPNYMILSNRSSSVAQQLGPC
jgi:hypothetical protein